MREGLGQGVEDPEEEDCSYDNLYWMIGRKKIDSERRAGCMYCLLRMAQGVVVRSCSYLRSWHSSAEEGPIRP